MSSFLVFRSIDLQRVKAALGSGDDAFCAKVLKSIPEEAESRGMDDDEKDVAEWERGVRAIVLGTLGEAMSGAEPLPKKAAAQMKQPLALAYSSVLQALAQEVGSGEDSLQQSGFDLFWKTFMGKYLTKAVGKALNPGEKLFSRPLFGVESSFENALWGALDRGELAALDDALPTIEDAPDAGDGDVEQWYGDFRDIVASARQNGLDLVTFYG
jgi:hypothetical protein